MSQEKSDIYADCDDCERLWQEYASAIISHMELKEQATDAPAPQVQAAKVAREVAGSVFRAHRDSHNPPRKSAGAAGTSGESL